MHFLFLSIFSALLRCTLSDESSSHTKCEHDDSDNNHDDATIHQKQKYLNPKWQPYLDLINEAERDYVECERDSGDCTTCHNSVIHGDLAPFSQGISEVRMQAAANISRVTKYQVIDHKLYRSENCMFPFRCKGIEHFLKEILSELPNTEFYLNTRDWPMAGRYLSGEAIPVFSFSKTKHYWDIMYPAWTFWEGGPALEIYPTGLGRWDKHIKLLTQQANKFPWQHKLSKGFFRGSRTSDERDALILLSRKHGDLLDAQYTKNQAWKSDKDTIGAPPAKEVPLEDHCRYKYLFNYRGVAASFRLKHLFLCASLVFHVGDEWQEFFYPALKAWYHYIPLPVSADQHQIQQILQFARENDVLMQKIANRGYNFILNHLKMRDISCYWKKLLQKYTDLLQYEVKKDGSLFEL